MKTFVAHSLHLFKNENRLISLIKDNQLNVICLDHISASILSKNEIDYSFIDDCLDYRSRIEVHMEAQSYESKFIQSAYKKNKFRFDIADDRVILNCYWYELALQKKILEYLEKNNCTELYFLKFIGYGPAVHESSSDTFGNYWMKTESSIKIRNINVYKKVSRIKNIFNILKIKSRALFNYFYIYKYRFIQKNVIFSCSAQEFFYYKKIILDIVSDVGKDNFLLFITNINLISALKLGKKNKIDALSFLPNLTRKIFHRKKLYRSKNFNNSCFRTDHDSFSYLENTRWPALDSHEKKIDKLITWLKPKQIIYTSLEDYSNQMIGKIALKNNIKSLSLPHGILATTRRGINFSDYYGVGNTLAKFCAESSGINKNKIVILDGLDPSHEYPMESKIKVNKNTNVLVLLDPVKSSQETRVYSAPPIGYRDQINGLKDIYKLLSLKNFNVIIKTHPGWPEHELIELAEPKLLDFVCPSDTSLDDLVEKVDVVIAVNYYGAALVPVAKKEIPTILHYTAPIEAFSKINNTYSRFFDIGLRSNSYEQLSYILQNIINDKSYMLKSKEIIKRFNNNYLKNKNLKTVSEFINI